MGTYESQSAFSEAKHYCVTEFIHFLVLSQAFSKK